MGDVVFPVAFTPKAAIDATDVILGTDAAGTARYQFAESAFRTFTRPLAVAQGTVANQAASRALVVGEKWWDGLIPGDGGREAAFNLVSLDITTDAVGGLLDTTRHSVLRSRMNGFTWLEFGPPTRGGTGTPGGIQPSRITLTDPQVGDGSSFGGISYADYFTYITTLNDAGTGRPLPVAGYVYEDAPTSFTVGNVYYYGANRQQYTAVGAFVWRNNTGRFEYESSVAYEYLGVVPYYLADGKNLRVENTGQPTARTPFSVGTVDTGTDLVMFQSISGGGSIVTNWAKIDGTGQFYTPKLFIGATFGSYVDTGGVHGLTPTNPDTALDRASAGILRLSGNPGTQGLIAHNVAPGANTEYGSMRWASNVFNIGTEKTGTGTARALGLMTDATVRWQIGATSGHLLAGSDLTYDIGAVGGNRPRDIFSRSLTLSPAANGSALTSSSYSVTGANTTFLVNLGGALNTTGVTTVFGVDVTNTSSGAGSMLFDWKVGGVSNFSQTMLGVLRLGGTLNPAFNIQSSVSGTPVIQLGGTSAGNFAPRSKWENNQNTGKVVFGTMANSYYLALQTGGNNDRIVLADNGNIGFHGGTNAAAFYGNGVKVMFIGEATTNPNANPATGALMYVDATTGITYIRGRAGTVTPIALA